MDRARPQALRRRAEAAVKRAAQRQARGLRLETRKMRVSSLKPLASIFLCCLLPAACCLLARSQSQTENASLHRWGAVTLFHGMPSDRVRAVAQGPDGAMWFGTDAGLARYDGRRIQT